MITRFKNVTNKEALIPVLWEELVKYFEYAEGEDPFYGLQDMTDEEKIDWLENDCIEKMPASEETREQRQVKSEGSD